MIKNVSIKNIRCHKDLTVKFSPKTTIITGKNGSGKTSVIEAVYIALQGSSFRGSDTDVLRHNSKQWKINLETETHGNRSASFNTNQLERRKKFTINGKTIYRLLSKNKLPAVVFEPEDLRLISGSPARRRQFIDRLISQLDPVYSSAIRKYERALRQRNSLLKNPHKKPDEVFVWNIALSEHGAYIIERRIAFIEQINTLLSDIYGSISESNDIISAHYSHTYIGDIKQRLLNELTNNDNRDSLLGFTSVGAHRHDIVFKFNGETAATTASRGETRSIAVALKLIEAQIIERVLDIKPVILLDDVFSELDDARQKALSGSTNVYQTIITSTHPLKGNKNYTEISTD